MSNIPATESSLSYDGNFVVTLGRSRFEKEWKPKTISWSQLLERLEKTQRTDETEEQFAAAPKEERDRIKDVGGFVGGALNGHRRDANAVAYRQLLTLDADFATGEIWDDFQLLNDYAAAMYSTHSHTEKRPRFRFIIPLDHPVTPEQYEAISRKVAEQIGINLFDDTTYEPNRLMYWPSTPSDGQYVFKSQDGPWLSADSILALYDDWTDMSSWPRSSRCKDDIRRSQQLQGDPTTKPALVGAFCRVYRVPEAIDKYLPTVYTQAGEGRYTYAQGSTTGGMVLFDDGLFCRSFHNTDPAGGHLLNAFDLVRIHLYGDKDTGEDKKQPIHKWPSFDAMRAMCEKDQAVLLELAKHVNGNQPGDPDNPFGLYAKETDYTDHGLAIRFCETYRSTLRYNRSLGWLFWDSIRWVKDDEASARMSLMAYIMSAEESLNMRMALASDDGERARVRVAMAQLFKIKSGGHLDTILKNAKAILEDKNISRYDADPWLLNTPSFIIDLRNGDTQKHAADKYCTGLTAITPAPGHSPKWDSFLDGVTCGDKEMKEYLQLVAGMAAVGKVYEEGMAIVYGPGGNGKSTLFGVLGRVLGEYSCTIRPELVLQRINGAEAFGMEAVRGKRLVVMGETDEGAKLSVSVMKRLTSRDDISANPKHQATFSFTPSHTLILHTNHLPRLGQLDDGTKRRTAIVPFLAPMKRPEEVITNFSDVLFEDEGPQILQWVIEGAKKFHAASCKLAKPAIVIAATDDYFQREDWVGNFLNECCETGKDENGKPYRISGQDLYVAYVRWAEQNGERPRRNRDFADVLTKHGFEKDPSRRNGAVWLGIKLLDAEV
jgi:P4 family phage/plasmid primase-like protien